MKLFNKIKETEDKIWIYNRPSIIAGLIVFLLYRLGKGSLVSGILALLIILAISIIVYYLIKYIREKTKKID